VDEIGLAMDRRAVSVSACGQSSGRTGHMTLANNSAAN